MKTSFHLSIVLAAAISIFITTGCATNSTQPEKNTESVPSSATKSGGEENGIKVAGINGKEGEVVGKPAKNSRFTSLKMGMGMKQVTDIVGPPTDQGAYITGKAFIPFYFGDDKHRFEMAYKGQGRLIFAGQSFGTGAYLIKIIHDSNDSGYRN